jgi:hypothetical protein
VFVMLTLSWDVTQVPATAGELPGVFGAAVLAAVVLAVGELGAEVFVPVDVWLPHAVKASAQAAVVSAASLILRPVLLTVHAAVRPAPRVTRSGNAMNLIALLRSGSLPDMTTNRAAQTGGFQPTT